jgi:AcrR family transcriptional regulator
MQVAGGARAREVREAALELFAEQGYRATTMGDIANLVGIRPPSLYNYVDSKYTLLVDLIVSATDSGLRDVLAGQASTDEVTEQLRRSVEAHVRYHARHRREMYVAQRGFSSLSADDQAMILAKRHEYEGVIRTIIQRGMDEGTFLTKSARSASLAIIDLGLGVAVWFRADGPVSETELAFEYGEFALRIVQVAR